MERGNVLVIGNSGVGKSTLINAVLGEERANTGWGSQGTTQRLEIYENVEIPFRIIDTVGFEPSFFKSFRAIEAVKKWSKESAKKGKEDAKINVIWFCVEGTSSKLFPKTIKDLLRATSMWKSVPIVVVITKSYSALERNRNIQMVKTAFERQKRFNKNLRAVVPVVAATYALNETAIAPPEGITELIDITNELMPEGIRAGEKDVSAYRLNRKRALAHSIVALSVTTGVTVGAVSIPIADALILSPLEIATINALAKVYEIDRDEKAKKFFETMVEIGTVGLAAKTAIGALKAIPGINLAASVINAIIAGSIIAALGQGAIYAFEKIYLGEKSVADLDWITEVMESKLSTQFIDKVADILMAISKAGPKQDTRKMILDFLKKSFGFKK